MKLSKPFAIATEGATTDGRTISADWIKQMAESYDAKSYTALGNLEHYISMMPDSVFSAYGKVIALSTRVAEILGEKKLQLVATFEANDAIVALQKAGKKMFCSIEVNPDFAKSGKAYLQGIAFTDSPASLGTEVMQFAAQAKANPFADRKKDAANLFTAAEEITLEWEEPASETAGATLFSKVKDLLGLGKKETDANFADIGKAVEAVALSQKDLLENFASIEQQIADLTGSASEAAKAAADLTTDFAAIKQQLGETDADDKGRPPATGGNGQLKTDC